MSDISSIKLPNNSSYNIKAKKIFYAECSTAKSNVAKVVTCSGFVLEAGAMIAIRFTDTTTTTPTSGNITLNINNTGAKNIVPKGNNSVYSYGWSQAFCNNQTWLFMYNGTYFVCMNQDNNTTYNDATTSAHGLLSVADKKALDVLKTPYATCATARSTAAKVATLANFTLAIGTTIAVKFTATDTTNPASGNLTLNVNNTGAKNIGFCRNGGKAAFNYSSAGYFSNNAIHIFTYDGTYWLCMDWNPDNNTRYSNMTAATASAAGKAGLVPAPAAGKNTAFLRGDGTWVIPTDSKVTSVGNHYTPTKSTTKSASGGTVTDITNLTSGTQVVTGVEMDAKGHVTGVTSVALKSTDTQVTVDSAMSSTSTNPVQNKVINSALAGKAAASHSHTISQISDFPASLPANGGNADNADTVDGFHASSLFCQRVTPSSKDCNDCTEVGAYFFNGCLANAPTSNGVLNSGTYFILESVMNNAAVIQTATFTHGAYLGKKFSRHLDMASNSWSAWGEIMKNQYATGLISGLSNGSAVTVSLKFAPVAVLFFDSTYIKPVSSGFSVSLGTSTFSITPSSVSAMGTTGVRYLAFGG